MKPAQASSVLITGTTSGVGLALLEHYVALGAQVICVNRRRVPELELRYAAVHFECIDVRSAEDIAFLVADLAASKRLPEVFILNAGINRVDNDDHFDLSRYQEVLDTNLYGVLNFVEPLTHLAPGKLPCHVVAISSMASYVGNPYGLGYSTSKKALTACFDVWSRMYAKTDLVFQQVMLGPVNTPIYTMSDQFPRWLSRIKQLFSASPDSTARAIARFARTRRRKLFHSFQAVPLYVAMRLLQSLIPGFFRGRKTLAGKARRAEAEAS